MLNYFPNNLSILEGKCFVIENFPKEIKKFELRMSLEYHLIGTEFEWTSITDIYIQYSDKAQCLLQKAYITMQSAEVVKYLVDVLKDLKFSDGSRISARILSWNQKY